MRSLLPRLCPYTAGHVYLKGAQKVMRQTWGRGVCLRFGIMGEYYCKHWNWSSRTAFITAEFWSIMAHAVLGRHRELNFVKDNFKLSIRSHFRVHSSSLCILPSSKNSQCPRTATLTLYIPAYHARCFGAVGTPKQSM